ncbi:MAG TPA: ATP-binding protein [Candidatus Angelobacter sp.]|nr:ATP-binding protein [Candidatus Angelobacter sp.]
MQGRANPFSDLRPTPANHFKLCFYRAVLNAIQQVGRSLGSFDAAFSQFPFLAGYNNELAERGLAGKSLADACAWWTNALAEWELAIQHHLPLRALCEAAELDETALALLMTIGLVEEDARFGFMFEYLQGITNQPRPTQGLLHSWFGPENVVRSSIRRMQEIGLMQVTNADVPRSGRALQVPTPLWDAIRGERPAKFGSWARYRAMEELPQLSELTLPPEVARQAAALPPLFVSGEVKTLVVRGPQHNGRRTLLAAIAAMLGRSMLEVHSPGKADDERWKLVGPLSTLLHAMPVIVLEPAPGETAVLPEFDGFNGPVGLVLDKRGGVSGPPVERAFTMSLKMPDVDTRRLHWRQTLEISDHKQLDNITERFRLTSGNIRRTARLALSYAAVENRPQVNTADVQQASRALSRQTLETLARRVNTCGDWDQLAVTTQTLSELYNLESRCRHRERLHDWSSSPLNADRNPGVRALFSGPSGTGKTLAAQLLAAELQMDLYRLDLSAVVNKYIGETEKNLDQVFARAEELDVILLLDEGDALLTQRTNVQTSNDRYANLETNYLLQRLESFESILIVTTNAVDRIDNAFQRRMDVVVDFRPPDAAERWNIWQMHLPAGHEVDAGLLNDIAGRCIMTGGQIRNAALHASVLALEQAGAMTSLHLEAAVHREYRKLGAVCPLRRSMPLAMVGQ